MAFNRAPFVNVSPKMETVFEKTSIQREYRLQQSSTDALNLSQSSTPRDGVTSDSFIPHGFYDQKLKNSSKSEEKPTSLQSEDTISSFEREIQRTSEELRNLSSEFIVDIADTRARDGEQVDHRFNTASKSSTQPKSKTTLFKSFFEHSQDAHGESTTQEFSSQQGFEERGIDEALTGKELLAHSTKKLPAPTAQDRGLTSSGLKGTYFNSDSTSDSRDEFSRYGNASDASRRFCKPWMYLILTLLVILLALLFAGLVDVHNKEQERLKIIDDCLKQTGEALDRFCRLETHTFHFNWSHFQSRETNSLTHMWFKEIVSHVCTNSLFQKNTTDKKLTDIFNMVDPSLLSTVENPADYFKPIFLSWPMRFNVKAKEANATIQLLKAGMYEFSYLPVMEMAYEAHEYLKNHADNRNWVALEFEFFDAAQREKKLSTITNKESIFVYEGSPQEFYWDLRFGSRCDRVGDIKVNYSVYREAIEDVLERMKCRG